MASLLARVARLEALPEGGGERVIHFTVSDPPGSYLVREEPSGATYHLDPEQARQCQILQGYWPDKSAFYYVATNAIFECCDNPRDR
jgi:hypothetical protein